MVSSSRFRACDLWFVLFVSVHIVRNSSSGLCIQKPAPVRQRMVLGYALGVGTVKLPDILRSGEALDFRVLGLGFSLEDLHLSVYSSEFLRRVYCATNFAV